MRNSKYFLGFLLGFILIWSTKTFSQVTVTSSDSLNCGTTCTTLTAQLEGDVPTNAGITSDDVYSIPHNIGFSFNFYGTNYTQIVIGANGSLDFNVADAGAYDPWPISAALLGNSSKFNNICGPWCDIDIFYSTTGGIGTETYSTDGVAPFRKFAVTWCGCQMYSCGAQRITSQIIIYETTNVIEVHVAHKVICAGWNGGYAIIGVQNASGTAATVAPGRDFPSVYTCTDEAWRFTPNTTLSSYSVSAIPYAPIPLASSNIYWYNATSGAYIGAGFTTTVCPTSPTTYKAAALGCADSSFGYYTVTTSAVGPTITLTPSNPTICGACDGQIVLHGMTAGLSDTVRYTLGGAAQPPVIAIVASDGTITIGGLCTGTYDNFIVKQLTCFSLPAGPVTLVNPPIAISGITPTNPSLCGVCDGKLVINGLYANHLFTVNYNFNGIPQTAVTTTTSAAGTITLTGLCAGIYDNIVASYGVCITPPAGPDTLVNPPISISSVTPTDPSYCGLCDGSLVLNGLYANHIFTVNYQFNGIAQPPLSVTSSATGTITITGLCAGTYTNIIAQFGDCITPPVGPYTLNNPPTTPINLISFVNPTQCGYCNGSIVIGSLTPYTTDSVFYSINGTPQPGIVTITQVDSTIHLPGLCAGNYTNFTVKVGACLYTVNGSANLTTDSIHLVLDTTVHFGCHGDSVYFHNTSNSAGATLTYVWDFGDGSSDTSISPMHIFAQGSYTVTLIATNHGCTSDTTINVSLIHPLHAGFIDTPNVLCQGQPVTYTNTTISTGPTTYLWNFGNGNTSDSVNGSNTYTNAGIYTITLVANDEIPCHDTTTGIAYVDTISGVVMSITDTVICQGTYMTFQGYYSPNGNTGITWNFGDGDSTVNHNPVLHAYGAPGTYTITVDALYRACPDISTTRTVTVIQQPHVDLGSDTTICPGSEPIIIGDTYNSTAAGTSWLWNTGQTTKTITVTAPGYYYLTVTIGNCGATDTIWVQNDCYMNLPNVFTPNGDGVNDYFFPRSLLTRGLTEFHMNIFNRWGQLIFETSSLDGRGWDGKFNDLAQPEGVYVYIIDATFKDGQKEHHQGNVTLLR